MTPRPWWKSRILWLAAPTALALVWLLWPKGSLPLTWAFGRGVPHAVPGLYVAAIFLAAPFVYRFVRGSAPQAARLAVTFCFGIGLLYALVVAEGRGLEPLRDTLWRTGHAEFIRVARDQPLDGLVGRFDQLVRERRWIFPRAKPPGALAFYRGLVWLADSELGAALGRVWAPTAPETTRDLRIAGVAFTVLPMLTFFALFPLWWLVRILAGAHEADLAALLYVVTPSVLLVTNHLDSTLFPLCGIGSAALVLWGTRARRPWAVFLGGAVLSLGIFATFGLLPLVPLIGLLPLCDALIAARSGEPLRRRLARGIALGALVAAGLLAVHLALILGLGYDFSHRFRDATSFQTGWWNSNDNWLIGAPLQFFVWLGVPITAAFLVRAFRADWSQTGYLVLGTLLIFALTNAVGNVRAEAERIWLYFVPFFCAGAATTLARWEDDSGPRLVPTVLVLELATAFLLKFNYTF